MIKIYQSTLLEVLAQHVFSFLYLTYLITVDTETRAPFMGVHVLLPGLHGPCSSVTISWMIIVMSMGHIGKKVVKMLWL